MTGCGRPGSPVRACGSMGDRAAWQRRAPPGHPLLRGRPLLAQQDRGAAAEAGLAAPSEDPVVPAPPGIAGGVLLGVVQVRAHQRAGALDQRGQVGDVGHPRPRVHAADEQRLDLVEVADAGEVALVDQRDADLLVGVLAHPAERLLEVPVRARHVGPEVTDQAVLLRGGHEVDVVQPVTDALPVVGRQDHPDVVGGPAVPLRAGPVDVPAAVHAEVGAQRAAVGQPDQQVLPARHDLADCDAGQVDGRQLRDPELAPAQGRRPARSASAARPARRCLPRARVQCPCRGSRLLRWCESPDNRDDGRPSARWSAA